MTRRIDPTIIKPVARVFNGHRGYVNNRKPVTRVYNANGLAGCVTRHKSRITGSFVSVYHGGQSGKPHDPAQPWILICDEHDTTVGYATLSSAKEDACEPEIWCDGCRTVDRQPAE